jgi:hypothetical protein
MDNFYFILFIFLFVYLNSPADHLAHRRGPQVGKRWSRTLLPSTVLSTLVKMEMVETPFALRFCLANSKQADGQQLTGRSCAGLTPSIVLLALLLSEHNSSFL